jgi:integrase
MWKGWAATAANAALGLSMLAAGEAQAKVEGDTVYLGAAVSLTGKYTTAAPDGSNCLIKGRFSPTFCNRGMEPATASSLGCNRSRERDVHRTNLTDARVTALKPRKATYDVRDGKLKGFGVRVLASGSKRFFVHSQHRGERVWKILGDAGTMTVKEARSRAIATLAAIRRGKLALPRPDEILFEAVAETVFERYARLWKPGTLRANRTYLRNQLMPYFSGRPVADIDRRDVRAWFASMHATPVAADRSMPILSVIMKEAEATGLRPEGSNPCRGIRRYRRKGRERFLSDEEIRRLSRGLSACCERYPRQVAIVRLLLLTGCRNGEILTLLWSDYREGRLFLRDSKTGPRTVWLSDPARRILDSLERTSRWVFPASSGDRPQSGAWLYRFWRRLRAEAGLGDVRLHDLRHTHASIALRQGETILAIGKLLGHADPETTLKYTHFSDDDALEAAETVGAILGN